MFSAPLFPSHLAAEGEFCLIVAISEADTSFICDYIHSLFRGNYEKNY